MQPLISHRNRTVRVDQLRIIENALVESYLTADANAASGTLTIKDIDGFAIAKFAWINPFGANSEIIAVHASTAPTGSTLTLASNTAFKHYTGEKVYYVEFNQIEVNHAATIGGSKTVLATSGLIEKDNEFVYLDISQSTGFYFARFKNSIASTFGSYSDGVAYGGWAENTVGYMVYSALDDLDLKFSEKITVENCIRWVNSGMRMIKGKLRSWPEHFVFNYLAGQVTRGNNTVTMPTNIYDLETNRSINAVRIGDALNLIYVDPASFDAQMKGVTVTQVRTQASVGATSLAVDNSYDYEDTGTVDVYVSGVLQSIAYTAVTRDTITGGTAAFTGIPASGTGSITAIIPLDTNVWQGETESKPTYFTVRNGGIEFWPLVDATNDNANAYLDYNTEALAVNSEIDPIDFQRFDILQAYLTWRIWCKSENSSKLDKTSGYYTDFKETLNDAVRTLRPLSVKTAPKINTMSRRRNNNRPNIQNLSIADQ